MITVMTDPSVILARTIYFSPNSELIYSPRLTVSISKKNYVKSCLITYNVP